MIAVGQPFDWHLHLFWLLAFPVLVGLYLWATRPMALERRCARSCASSAGCSLLVLAVTWPLGDLAAHWLLVALVLQRLLLTLAVPPLLVLGLPRPLIARLTRPAPVDAVLRVAMRPGPAVAIVTVIAVATLDDRCGEPGCPLRRGPGGDRTGGAGLGLRPVGPGADRAARNASAVSARDGAGT